MPSAASSASVDAPARAIARSQTAYASAMSDRYGTSTARCSPKGGTRTHAAQNSRSRHRRKTDVASRGDHDIRIEAPQNADALRDAGDIGANGAQHPE